MTKHNDNLSIRIKGIWQDIVNKQRIDILILAIVCLVIIIINYVWRSLELRPPHWDMGRHLFNSIVYYDYAKLSQFSNLIVDYRYYPPFLYWVAIPYYLFFGISIKTAVLSNSLFIFIMAFSVYGLGCRLWGRRIGILSAVFILSSPMLVTQFKEFQLDAPATAMVALCLYLLIRTNEFENRWWSLIFGFVLGLTMLTKWTLFFVLALPLAYAIVKAILADIKNKNTNRLFHILVSSLTTFFIASFWYIQNFSHIKFDLLSNSSDAGVREGDPMLGSFASNIWYLKNLINNQLYFFPFIFFIVGIIYTFNKKKYFVQNIYPWLLVIGTIGFFTILRNKDARYTLPMLVGLAIISTYWIAQIESIRIKNFISVLLITYSIIAFWAISFGLNILPKNNHLGNITIFEQKGYLIGPPTNENWRQQEIFNDLSARPGSKLIYMGLIPDEMYFNSWGNNYFASKGGITIVDSIERANYAVVPKGTEISNWPKSAILKTYILPNGSQLELLKRIDI